ncbi:hypothetical protein ISS86_00245 [Candidatus Microgenomates bacterium]|nr:hypothetical protein [Candidatus Microgenomates bacterium]
MSEDIAEFQGVPQHQRKATSQEASFSTKDLLKGEDKAWVESNPIIPTALGPIWLKDLLGQGAYGIVMSGEEVGGNKIYALKIIKDRENARKLEAGGHEGLMTIKTAHHSPAPRLYKIFEHNDRTVVIMELVQGPLVYRWPDYLRKRFADKGIRDETVVINTFDKLESLCNLLTIAEENKVIVHDYKADNFRISTSGPYPTHKWLDLGAWQTSGNIKCWDTKRESNLKAASDLTLRTLHNLIGFTDVPKDSLYHRFIDYQHAKQEGRFDENPLVETLYLKLAGLTTESYKTTAQLYQDVRKTTRFISGVDKTPPPRPETGEPSLINFAFLYAVGKGDLEKRAYESKLQNVLQIPEKPQVDLKDVDSALWTLLLCPLRLDANPSREGAFFKPEFILGQSLKVERYVLDKKADSDKILWLSNYLTALSFATDSINRCQPSTNLESLAVEVRQNIRELYRFFACNFTVENIPETDSLPTTGIVSKNINPLTDYLEDHTGRLTNLLSKMHYIVGVERYAELRDGFLTRVENGLEKEFVDPENIEKTKENLRFLLGS